ncbi:response regulator transcription factor [Pelagicoccus sp. SDUM812002]|uniref:response regulator transcription factor n=1 Tax=Pelagicoccus sp. SDUM812002 TaxID=3041266 RepID=UPI00280FC770|nr:response regulator transcription factor [Pelagicoccus sp. SDUM812002]MDQ8187817.1 response regulator transcription factor [Pelagicoccus sp. SDUM812002]
MDQESKIRILLVDDHIVLRMGLVTAANGESDMEIVGEAENGTEAVDVYEKVAPDVVVMDLRMPEMGGLDAIRILKKAHPGSKILVFSNYASGDEVLQAFREGASGFVVKEMPLERLLDGIRKVHSGVQYMPEEISARLTSRIGSQLSTRELEVLTLVARGCSNKEIASELNLAEGTVKVHVTNILSKLRVSDRIQAILAAVKRGIITME